MQDSAEQEEKLHPLHLLTDDSLAFQLCRYNFKPASVDHSQPGEVKTSAEILDSTEKCKAQVTFKANQGNDVIFNGYYERDRPGGMVDCVLLQDSSSGEYTLARQSGAFNLTHTRDASKDLR